MSDPRGAGEGSPQAQPKGGTNGWAIASLVTGIGGFVLPFLTLPLIFGYVALSQIKKDPSIGGRGFAVAGVVLGWIQVGFVLVFILLVLWAFPPNLVSFTSVTG